MSEFERKNGKMKSFDDVNVVGFTENTKVWHSAGFYRQFNEIFENRKSFMTDSFDEEQCVFVVERSTAKEIEKKSEFIEITYGQSIKLGNEKNITVKCALDQEFLTCNENNEGLHYNNDATFFWVKARNLKKGTRLVAEDANIIVKEIKKVIGEERVYSVKSEENLNNFSIELGVIVKGLED